MGKGLNWLPCCRHRQEKAKQRELEEARRKEEEKRKAEEEARRKEEKEKANQSRPAPEQDAGNKAPEPAKPSAVEQATPSSTLSIHQEVWNEAYEAIVKDKPKLVIDNA